ncbi:MAG TPA: di-heme oxidoredictase family protein [Planctomycetaceae bacterium]|nr:di-heme oxidoredictase family protein [Planctomycetaceae bacterium]
MSAQVRLALVGVVLSVPLVVRWATWPESRRHDLHASAVAAGKELFLHEWTPGDALSPGGDGLGPVFNATSCVACHRDPIAGGSGPIDANVTTFVIRPTVADRPLRQGVVHAAATSAEFRERLQHLHPSLPEELPPPEPELPTMAGCFAPSFVLPEGIDLSQRNTPALFGARLIDEIPDEAIIAGERRQRLKWGLATHDVEHAPVGRALRLPDGRVGRFGWKGQTPSLAGFVQAACANELGLGNPGQAQPVSLAKADYAAPGLDLTQEQCDQITAFCASLERPVEIIPTDAIERGQAQAGKKLFHTLGCADCHTPDLGGVEGLYSDLLLHRMGRELRGGGGYDDPPLPLPTPDDESDESGPHPTEWRTPPLWAVADTAPYLHDGRAETLHEAILLHDGQGKAAADRFRSLPPEDQTRLLAFLNTLRAPQ